MAPMELRQLRCFAATAELLNFTRAAERLRVAQPALSRQIRSLEEELGISLLERDSRRVALTAAGAVFYEDVREILERVEAAESRIMRFHREAVQAFALGYAPSLSGPMVPRLIRRLAELAPRLRVDLRDATNAEMVDAVRDRSLDAALLPAASVPRGDQLTLVPLHQMRFSVALPAGHGLAGRRALKLADLVHENLIAYDRRQYADYWSLLSVLYTSAKLPLIVAAEVDSGSALMTSVLAGQGVAIVASTMADNAPSGILFRPLRAAAFDYRLALLHHRDLPARLSGPLRQVCLELSANHPS
jgi:LysR family transcriptional regulator, benzoate and cis,cis-muconate-responsive activator of ben and cat genes